MPWWFCQLDLLPADDTRPQIALDHTTDAGHTATSGPRGVEFLSIPDPVHCSNQSRRVPLSPLCHEQGPIVRR